MPHLTPLFARLSRAPCEVSSADMQIERVVVLSYHRTSALNHVNEARLHLFTQNRKIDYIPPTYHALEQHLKRAVYHIWGQCLVANPELPQPSLWGWNKATNDNTWTPCWSTLPEADKACQELLKCECKRHVPRDAGLSGAVYRRLDDQTCITALFVAYIWCYVWIYFG